MLGGFKSMGGVLQKLYGSQSLHVFRYLKSTLSKWRRLFQLLFFQLYHVFLLTIFKAISLVVDLNQVEKVKNNLLSSKWDEV